MSELEIMFSSRISIEAMVKVVNSSAENFNETIQLACTNKTPQSWRAAWILGHCTKKNDQRISDFLNVLITTVDKKKDGHQRELIKLIIKNKLNEEQEGLLFDICMNIWETSNKSPSVRYFAFQFIVTIVKKYPELRREIDVLTQPEYLETLSPGIRKGLEKRIKEML
ncbi:MAG: hypothetical protein ACJA2S_004356 [Cyclobacteriaceae bacterium]|jgi:hypothetical protein